MNAIDEYRKRRGKRLAARGFRLDDDDENGGGKGGGGHGNTKIPYGLCQREGIEVKAGWTPKDAWDALADKGYSASEVYKELKETGKVAPRAPKEEKKADVSKRRSRFEKSKEKAEKGTAETEKKAKPKKMATYGKKVKSDFIDYVKKQVGVDLTKAIDTYYEEHFPSQKAFTIDTALMSKNDLFKVKTLARQNPGKFDVRLEENGVTQIQIRVARKQD